MSAPSGEQYELEYRSARATITELGATLRSLEIGGSPVILGFSEDEMCSGGRGQVLAPWPNRLGDGFYIFRGIKGQAPIDEVSTHCAIHGLVRWLPWHVQRQERALLEMAIDLLPTPAYPFELHLSVTYELSETGLSVRVLADGDERPGPFGIGFHPYFLAHEQGLAGARLSVPVSSQLILDDRGLPTGSEPLDPTRAPLASGEGLDLTSAVLDDCFTGIVGDNDGAAVVLQPGGGPHKEIRVRLGEGVKFVQCFTGDTLSADLKRRAVAIEPMSCPPNALASGESLVDLANGTFEMIWSVEVVPA